MTIRLVSPSHPSIHHASLLPLSCIHVCMCVRIFFYTHTYYAATFELNLPAAYANHDFGEPSKGAALDARIERAASRAGGGSPSASPTAAPPNAASAASVNTLPPPPPITSALHAFPDMHPVPRSPVATRRPRRIYPISHANAMFSVSNRFFQRPCCRFGRSKYRLWRRICLFRSINFVSVWVLSW